MPPLLADLLRPHRRTLAVILTVMLVQMAMSLAAPWPLKIIIDLVIGRHQKLAWINWVLAALGADNKTRIAERPGLRPW